MAKKKDNTTFESEGKGESKSSNRLPIVVFVLIAAVTYKYASPVFYSKLDNLFSKNSQNRKTKNEARNESIFNELDDYSSLYNSVLVQKYLEVNPTKASLDDDNNDNHANQLNPNNDAYWQSRGYDERPDNWEDLMQEEDEETKANLDNYSNQLNPNNDAYWQSRGYDERPDNWREERTK